MLILYCLSHEIAKKHAKCCVQILVNDAVNLFDHILQLRY